MKGDLFYVNHIVECIARIERYSSAGESQFYKDELIQDAVLRNLQVLAESSQRLSADHVKAFLTISSGAMLDG